MSSVSIQSTMMYIHINVRLLLVGSDVGFLTDSNFKFGYESDHRKSHSNIGTLYPSCVPLSDLHCFESNRYCGAVDFI